MDKIDWWIWSWAFDIKGFQRPPMIGEEQKDVLSIRNC